MTDADKSIWIEALESGKYQKDSLYLRRTTSNVLTHTYLGVFCDINKHVLKAKWIRSPFPDTDYFYFLGEIVKLPKILTDKFNIKTEQLKKLNSFIFEIDESDTFFQEINLIKDLL